MESPDDRTPGDADAADRPLLVQRLPGLAGTVPWVPLGAFPTPVERIRPEGIPGDADVWVKRDDLTGEDYGGNKVRKLEWILAEARRRKAGRLVTAGALGSHHALATTLYGRRLGFPVTLVLTPQRPTPHVRAVLLASHALGAEVRLVGRLELIPWGLLRERLRHLGRRPYVVPPGGSDARGTLGYANAALELLEQVREGRLPMPRVVHVACGTMGTAAGLALGFALGRADVRIDAVRVVSPLVANARTLRRLVRSAGSLLARSGEADPPVRRALESVRLLPDQLGEGYGVPTDAGERATERMRAAGLDLDPTYTAKAAAGLLDSLDREEPGPHLFWHTLSHGLPRLRGAAPPSPEDLPDRLRSFFPSPGTGGR